MFDLYSTAQLLPVLQIPLADTTYWLDNFFPNIYTSDSEEIMFDKVTKSRQLAPFVSPVVQGRVMRTRGYSTRVFRPAYTKPKHVVDPSVAFIRRAGEAITGTLSAAARWNAAVTANILEEREAIVRLWNWMAGQAIMFGSVTVAGDDYPTQVVDFGRDGSLTVVPSGTAQWGQSAADPLADIATARKNSFMLSGAPITRLTLGLDAFDLFFADTKVQALLKTELGAIPRTSDSTLSALGSPGEPYEFRGILQGANGQGRLEIYTYNEMYEDRNGDTQPFMNSLDVIGTGPGIQGTRCFGAIRDKRAGLQALQLFPKMWDQEDPSVTYTMTQSAPLMVPVNVNNTFRIRASS